MTDPKRNAVLRRMIGAGRPPPEFGEVSPAKALRLALAKAGQDELRAIVTGSGVEETRIALDRIAEAIPEGSMTVLMEGPGRKRGLISLDAACVAAVTEGLTTGRISEGPPPDRTPTNTDALMSMRFLVMVMTIFAARLVGHPAASWATGYVPDEPITDLRRLAVLMDDEAYRLLTIGVDFALGAKVGQISLILPWAIEQKLLEQSPESIQKADDAWSEKFQKAIMPAKARLDVVLLRLEMSLEEIMQMKEGTLLPVRRQALDEVELETLDGRIIARAKLGQSQGLRAVRINSEDETETEPPELDQDVPSGDPRIGLTDAMSGLDMGHGDGLALGGFGDYEAEEDDAGGGFPEMSPISDLPPLDGDGIEGLGSLPMTDLDDLPMTID